MVLSGYLLAESFLASPKVTSTTSSLIADAEGARRVLIARRETWRGLGPASSPRAIFECAAVPLVTALGFEHIDRVQTAGTHVSASIRQGAGPVALLVTSWRDCLDSYWRHAVITARDRSASWCLLFNGTALRIVDATRLYSRRYAEIDLDLAIDRADTFRNVWHFTHARALTAPPTDSGSLRQLVAASEKHAAGVSRSLRQGVLEASADVFGALVTPRARNRVDIATHTADCFEQALTIVYRVLFLLFAEARALVPLWHPIYRESYSLESLGRVALGAGPATGIWDALKAICRLAHAGCRAGTLRVTPFNGRLFAPDRTPLADRADLDDDLARRAIVALTTCKAPDRSARVAISYRDLGVEQLGAVYETLLDYAPQPPAGARERGKDLTVRGRGPATRITGLVPGSGLRKSTATFYTPQPIADYLVRRTLGPLVHGLAPEGILALRIVDPAMGSGAVLVAAGRFLAACYETALVERGECAASDITEADRCLFRRMVVERCLYGVDLNPMAVQLARLSLWLATLAADRPLSFLDHRLLAGDSVLGTWLACLTRAPRRNRIRSSESLPLFSDEPAADALRAALPVRFAIESTPSDTLDQVRGKERQLARLATKDTSLARWKQIANLWCSSWLAADERVPPNAFGVVSDAILTGQPVAPARAAERLLATAQRVAEAKRLFHWELECPEVFFDGNGRRLPRPGFDAVVGNPPWDMMRADQDSKMRADLTATLRFSRDSGVYVAQSRGHANCYHLFVERAIVLTRSGGRIGLVLPAGMATDHGNSRLRRHLLNTCDVDTIVGVDNTRALFPIHRSVRFLLVTASAGRPTERVTCRFGIDRVGEIEALAEDGAEQDPRSVRLHRAALDRISGPDLAVPYLCHPVDLTISEKAAALFPPLGALDGWGAHFARELNATEDRSALRPLNRSQGSRKSRQGLPVIDGRHIEPFRVRVGQSTRTISTADAMRLLGSERPFRARLAYRDVASATNRVTLIAAILPAGCVSTHTVFCLRTPVSRIWQHFLCGLFNSLVVNYLVRLRVTTHVTTAVVERLPIPTPRHAPVSAREIAALARLLSRGVDNLAFAQNSAVAEASAFARLNALVARLYQLTRDELEHLLGTFPLLPQDQRQAALIEFAATVRD